MYDGTEQQSITYSGVYASVRIIFIVCAPAALQYSYNTLLIYFYWKITYGTYVYVLPPYIRLLQVSSTTPTPPRRHAPTPCEFPFFLVKLSTPN